MQHKIDVTLACGSWFGKEISPQYKREKIQIGQEDKGDSLASCLTCPRAKCAHVRSQDLSTVAVDKVVNNLSEQRVSSPPVRLFSSMLKN